MKIIEMQGSFIEKHIDLCEKVYAQLYHDYKKAINEKDQKAEAKLAAALIKIGNKIDKAWKDYNEEIGDGIDQEKVYEDEIKGDKK